jgi:thiol-disulfide isomerase/thioredoxin
MFKKIIRYLLTGGVFLLLVKPVLATETTLHFFWASGCPHCAEEKIFLETLKEKYPQLTVRDYEITYNRENLELLQKVGLELEVDVSGVPFTIVGKEYFAGYLNDETTGREIEKAVECAVRDGCEDLVSALSPRGIQEPLPQVRGIPETLKLPIVGELPVKGLSLPLLTFIIALLDGFNPCAMWTLLFLISLLLGMKDKKRMWILGMAFIVASALVYFLFLSAWLNLFLFLGLVVWVRMVVGLVALFAGGYNLRDYWTNKKGGCQVMGDEKRQKIFEKIRGIAQKRQFVLALGGIILLAIAVNMVELVCSAGLPAIYTQILSLANLPGWQYYLYLSFYILIFMLDDLVVFFTAMVTLQAVGIPSKYSRYSHLIGGFLMLVIGILLLFKPEWLMFG